MPEKIGRYDIIGTLGKGAMGIVYKARDTKFDRIVAVKTISGADELSETDRAEYLQRFFQEAHAAGNLSHPNIVGIYDADKDPKRGISFITMEYVEGQSLEDLLAGKGSLSPEAALAIAIPVARALGFAHRKGIVHRDIKPANILIDAAGQAKLTDFGIAKVPTSKLTTTGLFLGTPGYMSPEQVFGDEVDGRSDLFSLAVVVYQMITGELPFPGKNITTITYKIVNMEPPPPTHINFRLGSGFDSTLARGLAKSPDRRFQTAEEMAGELERLLEDESLVVGELGQAPADGVSAGPQSNASGVSSSTVVSDTAMVPIPAIPAVLPTTREAKRPWRLKPGPTRFVAVSGVIGALLLTNAYFMWRTFNTTPVVLEEAAARPEIVKKYDLRALVADASSAAWPADQAIELAGFEFPSPNSPTRPAVAPAATVEVQHTIAEKADLPSAEETPPIPEAVPQATLNLVLLHPFESGTLVVHADGQTVYEAELGPANAGTGGFKKLMRTLGRKLKLKRYQVEGIVVPAGSNDISLAIVRSEGSTPPMAIVAADFAAGQERSLTAVCGRNSSAEMELEWADN